MTAGTGPNLLEVSWRPLLSFCAVVLIFSAIYTGCWYKSPDYCIITSEYNIAPIRELQGVLENNELPQQREKSVQDDLIGRVAELVNEKRKLEQDYENTGMELKEIEGRLGSIVEAFRNSRQQAIDDYKRSELSAPESELSRLEQALVDSRQKAGADCNSETASMADRLVCSDLAFRVSEKKREKEFDVLTKIVDGFGEFGDRELFDQFKAASEKVSRLRGNITDLRIKIGKKRGEIYDVLHNARDERLSRVGYWDFLYFSLGVSTASSFGDIMPNSTSIRMAVIIQVVISILLVAWLVKTLIG